MRYTAIAWTGLTALWAVPAQAASECWNFDFRASEFRAANAPEPIVAGSFTLMIDWSAATPSAVEAHPQSVDVTIAGHSYTPDEFKWSYSPADEKLILEPLGPIEDKELFVSAGTDEMYLEINRPRTTVAPEIFVYSVKGVYEKWVATRVAASARKCGMSYLPDVSPKLSRPTYIICDIGKDVFGIPGRGQVVLRNRSRRVLPAGTTLTYSVTGADGSAATDMVRLQHDLKPGAAVAGGATQSQSCRAEGATSAAR
jgi:hypothetical protein